MDRAILLTLSNGSMAAESNGGFFLHFVNEIKLRYRNCHLVLDTFSHLKMRFDLRYSRYLYGTFETINSRKQKKLRLRIPQFFILTKLYKRNYRQEIRLFCHRYVHLTVEVERNPRNNWFT